MGDGARVAAVYFLVALAVAGGGFFTPCAGNEQRRSLSPGFQCAQLNYIEVGGIFLLSNSSVFGLGLVPVSAADTTSFFLSVIHVPSNRVIWTANGVHPVSSSDIFVFDKDGDVYLTAGGATIWSTNTSGSGAASVLLEDSGNLVVLGSSPASPPVWQSFSFPTDTLLTGQSFTDGMVLTSQPDGQNVTYRLTMSSGDMVLYVGFRTPQPYWSIRQDNQKIVNQIGSTVSSANLSGNSWNFYDRGGALLWQLDVIGFQNGGGASNATLAAVLGNDGVIYFYNLGSSGAMQATTKVPEVACSTPGACKSYYICYSGNQCQCPVVLSSADSDCNPDIITSSCGSPASSYVLKAVESGVGYLATDFVAPMAKTNLTGCMVACMANCSCLALFYDDGSGNCFIFDQVGSFRELGSNASASSLYIKMATSSLQSGAANAGGGHLVVILIVCLLSASIILAMVCFAIWKYRKRGTPAPLAPGEAGSSDDDTFLDVISGVPVRFTYSELQEATDNFFRKLGQGGFGSVYLGRLADGSQVAVKKLESVGQGKKEFQSEVQIIGSIHHIHLVKLRGFCVMGSQKLLVYEYMANGSLDRWIFRSDAVTTPGKFLLDWDTRFSIAVGTAKGLAYLHEDCESKIIHCDIKPENVLLDDHFVAKVSDFGLAKLMNREQSQVFTQLRGTRGYLAPEWLTNYAISEKSDVYSYGMVLLEIISGRKNFDAGETSEKAHFPSYAFKKLEEGAVRDLFDARIKYGDGDERMETVARVALWCIQEDFYLRPPMSKVVQMLEGVADVPQPPTSCSMGYRLYANVFKSTSEEGTSSGPSDCNSDAFLSAVRLSGPR